MLKTKISVNVDVDLAVDQNQARTLSAQLATDKAGECTGLRPAGGLWPGGAALAPVLRRHL